MGILYNLYVKILDIIDPPNNKTDIIHEWTSPMNYFAKDKDAPNLFIGKVIGTSRLEGKIISFDENNIQMEILKINDHYFERYMDVGKIYPMFRHQSWTFERGLMLWEVEPSSMKRDVSQILLQWEEGLGWCWDLDM